MARFEIDEGAAIAAGADAGEAFFRMGLMHATGRGGSADLVLAHKWFNIAAINGHAEAGRHRKELSAEMSREEIAEAQRAAREWLSVH